MRVVQSERAGSSASNGDKRTMEASLYEHELSQNRKPPRGGTALSTVHQGRKHRARAIPRVLAGHAPVHMRAGALSARNMNSLTARGGGSSRVRKNLAPEYDRKGPCWGGLAKRALPVPLAKRSLAWPRKIWRISDECGERRTDCGQTGLESLSDKRCSSGDCAHAVHVDEESKQSDAWPG